MRSVIITLLMVLPGMLIGSDTQKMHTVPLSLNVNPSVSYANSTGIAGFYKYVDAYTNWLTTQGFTSLACSGKDIVLGNVNDPNLTNDNKLSNLRQGFYGAYKNGKYTGNGNPKNNVTSQGQKFAKCLTNAVYNINKDQLQSAIQKGSFFEMFFNRIRLQEALLGKIAMTATAVQNAQTGKNSYFTADEQKVLSSFVTSAQQAYKQTRYVNSGVTQQKFTPVDFFAGVVVINKINNGITAQGSSVSVAPNSVGFIPASGALNSWADVSKVPTIPFERTLSLRPTNAPTSGSAALVINTGITAGRVFVNVADNPVQFDQQDAFFREIAPWAVIIEFSPAPKIQGLAKLNVLDFGDQIKVSGMDQKAATTFTLKDVIGAPYDLYKKTHVDGFIQNYGTVKNYPFVNWFLQALYNGHLESSKYQVLIDLHGNLGGSNSWRTRVDIPWSQPLLNNYFAVNSGIDWKWLNALRVTKAALYYSYLKKDALTLDTMQNILQDPTKDYTASPSSANQAASYNYYGWQANSPRIASSSSAKQVYIGATKNYLPIVLAQDPTQKK